MSDGAGDDQLLFDANPQPMFVFDRETLAFLAVNQAACDYYGWTRDELLAMTLRDIRPPDEVVRLESELATSPKLPVTQFSRIGRHLTKGGRVFDVEISISRLTFHGRLASLARITEQATIDEAERRFQLMVEHSADGIAMYDERGIVRYMSPGGERMFGLKAGELVGQASTALTHPDDLRPNARLAAGQTSRSLTRSRHGDGSWRWTEAAATNLTHDPAVRAFVANFRDVTERHHAELSLRRSEEKFRTLIERSPTSTLVHHDGAIAYANPAMVVMLGYETAEQLAGKQVIDLVHPDDRDLVRERVRETATRGRCRPTEARMLRRDGSVVVVEAEGLELEFDGKPAHVVLGRDISERREMFARMALADRMVSVGTLAAGVAHEINNPLAYVLANLQILTNELPGILAEPRTSRLDQAEIAAVLADARDGAIRVSAIVRDLRALSRQEDDSAGQVDVVDVIASAIKMAHHEVRHRAPIVESYRRPLPYVHANAHRLGQVILNLLLNAAQAIAVGHHDENEIRVRAWATDDDRVCIEVEDTGVGIPAAVLERIFDPFFTTKPPGVGTGLGLSISHQIIKSINGEIGVTSTPGRGSTFRVTLPVAATAAIIDPEPPHPVGSSSRVLMIDDEAAVGRSTQLLLAPEHDVVPVTRAKDALERLLAGEQYDVILCDLMMPEMSGISFYEQLVRSAPHYMRRVVFLTGGAFTPESREFLASVTSPHLEKPFTERDLRRAIENVRAAQVGASCSAVKVSV